MDIQEIEALKSEFESWFRKTYGIEPDDRHRPDFSGWMAGYKQASSAHSQALAGFEEIPCPTCNGYELRVGYCEVCNGHGKLWRKA